MRAIYADKVAVVRANLHHHPSVRPLLRIVSMLSLNGNVVTWLEWR